MANACYNSLHIGMPRRSRHHQQERQGVHQMLRELMLAHVLLAHYQNTVNHRALTRRNAIAR